MNNLDPTPSDLGWQPLTDEQRRAINTKALEVQRAIRQREAEREAQSLAADMAYYAAVAEKALALYAGHPCKGELARIDQCRDEYAEACPQRDQPSCPRQIRAWNEARAIEGRVSGLDGAGLPQAIRNAVAGRLCATAAKQYVDGFLANPDKRILVMGGSVGVGKTTAAGYALTRERGLFIQTAELTRLQAFDPEDRQRLKAIQQAKLLVIDDLGNEFLTDWFRSLIDSLIVARFDNGLRTIVTCNISAKDFKARYGDRVADRIRGGGDFELVHGQSMRGSHR